MLPSRVTVTNNLNNFDGSINTDDGRLNFDSGDFIGGNARSTTTSCSNTTTSPVFSRFYYFYDAVLDDDSVGRSGHHRTAPATRSAARSELLDL